MKSFKVIKSGRIVWINKKGGLHREDGPAVEYTNTYDKGKLEWWCNNKKHRKDGPAVILPGKIEEYWVNGKLHREDGPALIHYINYLNQPYKTYICYYLNGEKIEKEDFTNILLKRKLDRLKDL